MNTPDLELLQFRRSHYNEKARWALDYKGLPHRRTTLIPGPHAPRMKKLTGGASTTVPALLIDGELVHGSDRIIAVLEERFPTPALYPADPAARERALAIQREFDADVGPMVRRAAFSMFLQEPRFLAATFAGHKSRAFQTVYRATLPLVGGMMRKSMGLTGPDSVKEAFEATQAALDRVARDAGKDGYLVGNAFSVADLTAAALLAPCVQLEHPDMKRPEPVPERALEWRDRWADHPGVEWVLHQYRTHRPPPAEVAAVSAGR